MRLFGLPAKCRRVGTPGELDGGDLVLLDEGYEKNCDLYMPVEDGDYLLARVDPIGFAHFEDGEMYVSVEEVNEE